MTTVTTAAPLPTAPPGLSDGAKCLAAGSADSCDSDADGWTDVVEIAVCGTARCADGTEDADGDTVPDVLEVAVCGSASCVEADADVDHDKIFDWVEVAVCGSRKCATGAEETDGDGIADWVEVLICDSVRCADGTKDLDGNGVADHLELAKCLERRAETTTTVKTTAKDSLSGTSAGGVQVAGATQTNAAANGASGWLARTGFGLGALVLVAGALVGAGVVVRRRARRGAGGES